MRMSTLAAAAMAFAAYKYLKRQRNGLAAGTGMGTGTDTPKGAERMQPAGVPPADKWYGSSSQQGSEPTSTDMPDLTRGA